MDKTKSNKPVETRYSEIKYRSNQPVQMVGKYTAERVLRTYTEDFIDEQDGQIHSIERHETIISKGEQITNDMVPKILFYMQEGGLKDVLVSNQNRKVEPYTRPHLVPYIVTVRVGRQPKKVIVQANSMRMALQIVADHTELKDSGDYYEITSAKMASEFIIIEDTLRKLEREEMRANQDPMDRDLKQELIEKKKDEEEEQNEINRYYQIDARVGVTIDENDRDTQMPHSFLVKVQDADLAKVLITKWIRKNLREKGKDADKAKIELTLDEAVIFNCTRVIPREFSHVYMDHEEEEDTIDRIHEMNEPDRKCILEQIINTLDHQGKGQRK